MTAGPLVAAAAGVPAGRGVDRYGVRPMTIGGLGAMAVGCLLLASLPLASGVIGYLLPLGITTAGFAVFQAANNTAVVMATEPTQRGLVSGLLNLARNLGLITGASVMGAVFAFGTGTADAGAAPAAAIASGTRAAFAVAVVLVASALVFALRVARRATEAPVLAEH